MITEQSLRLEVLDYLRTNYSIRLDIPAYRRNYSDTISLRLFKSPIGEHRMQNRYMMLIRESQELLKRNIVNTDKIKQFGENFFEIITQDILVLQGNEDIRKGFTKIRDQISYRVEELGADQRAIEEQCKAVSNKEQILTFLEGSFRSYLSQVRQVSQQYQSVNNVQVLTSINIDSLYSERLGNEQDYIQHYQPLLQVMQRLKSNMIKLYKELNGCEYYELPLRSVNFLANCKNLLLELEPFLIRPDCVFNRLIFHVVRGQKQNNRLIGRVFHANSVFANDVICDIFKAVFLSHMFQDRARAHKARLQQEKEQLIRSFENPNVNNDNFYGAMMKAEKGLNDLKGELEQLKNVIGMGKDKIMRAYLGRKQCKKIIELSELEGNCLDVMKFSKHMHDMLKFRTKMQIVKQKYLDSDRIANRTIKSIKQLEGANSKPTNANINELNRAAEQQFVQSYVLIQEGFLQLETIRQKLKDIKDEITQEYFSKECFPRLEQDVEQLQSRYRGTESEMLNSYQSLRKEKLAKAGQAREEVKRGLDEFSDYFEAKVTGEAGHEIRNEDSQCEEVKDYIIKVEKLQFLLNNYLSQGKDQLEEVRQYKSNFQCLLQVYEGSMDQRIFQSFVQKLNFQADDWSKRVTKVQELTRQLTRYVATLKKLSASSNSSNSKLFPKVSKLIKNRTQLYEIIQDMYEQFIQIYQTCKKGQANNPTDQGLKLFDQKSYKYVLMLYQYRNRTRAEVQELKDLLLPKRTLNYLLDDVFEPFLHIFKTYVGYTEEQLLTFTLRLEHALNYKTSHLQIIQLYEQTLAKTYNNDFFPNIAKISEEIVQLGSQNEKVLQLQQQQVMIYNLKQFKELAEVIKEHVSFAEAVLRGLKEKDLRMEVELTNRTLMILRDKLVGDWKEHRKDLSRSGAIDQLNGQAYE